MTEHFSAPADRSAPSATLTGQEVIMTHSWITWLGAAGAASIVVSTGCSGAGGTHSKDPGLHSQSLSQPVNSLDDCPKLDRSVTATGPDGSVIIEKACVVDDQGKYYVIPFSDTDTGVLVVPNGHKYSVVYQFGSEWVPHVTDLTNVAEAELHPTHFESCSTKTLEEDRAMCQPEPITPEASTVELHGNVLTHSMTDPLPPDVWAFSNLSFGALYPTDPNFATNIGPDGSGFGFGFTANFQTAP
jgi:hypothetical protein